MKTNAMAAVPASSAPVQADPFVALHEEPAAAVDFGSLAQRPAASLGAPGQGLGQGAVHPSPAPAAVPVLARLLGFDLLDQPVIGELAALPGQTLAARSVVSLGRAQVGRELLVCFADGRLDAPVIMGVIEPHPLHDTVAPAPAVSVVADGQRHVIEAEREIVLRCGEASITLTRAGKVLIKGHYILSRSSGYNKIKGAAIDIN